MITDEIESMVKKIKYNRFWYTIKGIEWESLDNIDESQPILDLQEMFAAFDVSSIEELFLKLDVEVRGIYNNLNRYCFNIFNTFLLISLLKNKKIPVNSINCYRYMGIFYNFKFSRLESDYFKIILEWKLINNENCLLLYKECEERTDSNFGLPLLDALVKYCKLVNFERFFIYAKENKRAAYSYRGELKVGCEMKSFGDNILFWDKKRFSIYPKIHMKYDFKTDSVELY